MALYSVDSQMNISLARGYAVDIPVVVRRSDDTPYQMIPGMDTLTFTVKQTVVSPSLIQKVTDSPVVSLAFTDTTGLPYGTYLYDLVLTHTEAGDSWVDTILGPCRLLLTANDDQLMDEYRRLLTSEYKTRPKLTQWLLWLLSEGSSYRSALLEFLDSFDLEYAVGKQLDTIGRIVGVGRLLNFYPSGGESPLMDDDTYRIVIKARIAQNMWKGTQDELYEIWSVLFPDVKIQIHDRQDMTFDVVVAGAFTQLMQELIQHGYIVPKPEGVRANIQVVDMTGLPLFAYDSNTYLLSGYTSHWAAASQ